MMNMIVHQFGIGINKTNRSRLMTKKEKLEQAEIKSARRFALGLIAGLILTFTLVNKYSPESRQGGFPHYSYHQQI